MIKRVKPGKYVVAVSGGVDSVVLLDLLYKYALNKNIELIVAHYDHGIRADSSDDRRFVADLAARYELPFEFAEGRLGEQASEALAREKRYQFLEAVRLKHQAQAIMTAHHQDDVLETAVINLIRGSGRRGLSSLSSNRLIVRPLLDQPKSALIKYATACSLPWREDPTNKEDKYLRNYVRHQILTNFSDTNRRRLLETINKSCRQNRLISNLLEELLDKNMTNNQVDRSWFNGLPHDIASEILMEWLKRSGHLISRRSEVERLVVGAKTARSGKSIDIDKHLILKVNQRILALEARVC